MPLCGNEDEPELLLHVVFDGAVKLKAISVIGGNAGTAPAKLKVYINLMSFYVMYRLCGGALIVTWFSVHRYINRDDLDFSAAEHLPAVQEWDLQEQDPQGVLEYPTQVSKFNGVYSLDLYFPTNFGADHTQIHFIGLKGEFSQQKREAVIAVYESRAQAADHKVPEGSQGASHHIS